MNLEAFELPASPARNAQTMSILLLSPWPAGYRVLVLEGRDRVGGRLNSTTTVVPDSHVDLGAMWQVLIAGWRGGDCLCSLACLRDVCCTP